MRQGSGERTLSALALRRSVRSLHPQLILVNWAEGMIHTSLVVERINYVGDNLLLAGTALLAGFGATGRLNSTCSDSHCASGRFVATYISAISRCDVQGLWRGFGVQVSAGLVAQAAIYSESKWFASDTCPHTPFCTPIFCWMKSHRSESLRTVTPAEVSEFSRVRRVSARGMAVHVGSSSAATSIRAQAA